MAHWKSCCFVNYQSFDVTVFCILSAQVWPVSQVQNNLGNLNGEHPSATDPSVHILIDATSEV